MRGADRPFWSRLSVRFAVMLTLALVPIGFFALIQTRALTREVAATEEQAMLGATLRAAEEETAMILRARGMMAALAQAIVPVVTDRAACSALVSQFAAAEPRASLVGFFPADGMVRCTSTGTETDLSQSPQFAEVRAAEAPYFIINRQAPISGASVLGISHPVWDAAGDYIGYVSLSVPHSALNALPQGGGEVSETGDAVMSFWSFGPEGNLLTASMGLDVAAQQLPSTRPLASFIGTSGDVFTDVAVNGIRKSYAVVPIVAGELYLMSRWDVPETRLFGIWSYLPVAMMWLAALVVAVAAAERLVTRHVRKLNRGIGLFAAGDRRLQVIDMAQAPVELRELGEAYRTMTEAITHGEAQMEDSLHQKEVLLREVHHRVKNNLQLIASIMNLQMRKAKMPETKVLLKGLQDRVMSLATIHRGLYQTSGLADVHVGELFTDIVRQITTMSSGGQTRFVIATDVDDIRMVPDQAVPLSLLMTEAVTNAIKHSAGSEAAPGQITLRLKRTGGSEAVMEVINSYTQSAAHPQDPQAPEAMNSGLGTQLIGAFARQLGGQLEQTHADGRYILRVTLTLAALAQAELQVDAGE